MKSRLTIPFVSLLLLIVLASSPPKTQAVWWVDELGNCSNLYVNQANYLKTLLDTNQIGSSEYDYNMEIYGGYYTECLSRTTVPAQEPDFCYAALLANQDCVAQAQNLDPEDPNTSSFYMECRQKSGIDLCQ